MVGFRIPLAGFRIPKRGFRIPQTKITWIPDSGLPYMGRCHFDNLIKLISLDNDCMFHFIFDVIYRKPCFIHIKSVRKVMSTTFSEISLVFES